MHHVAYEPRSSYFIDQDGRVRELAAERPATITWSEREKLLRDGFEDLLAPPPQPAPEPQDERWDHDDDAPTVKPGELDDPGDRADDREPKRPGPACGVRMRARL